MAYTSLYRKYRPNNFGQVIGQDCIVRTLKNQIKADNIGHAYIFTGTRGTGKTSVAKIFARAVNCLHPDDGSPCGKCENCVELAGSNNFDILELDAASNNSVEQIREITDKIGFPPTVGRYKVYIIDEVHMLSTAAFNALLKTLEEPPKHAIFILATTEIHKIPATILSRCLRFDFKLVPQGVIADRVREIFDDIGVKYESEALSLIAAAGAGSVRDALSVADMCVSYCDGNVTYGGVLEVLGASDPQKLRELAVCIASGDVDGALVRTAELTDLGKSVSMLAKDLAELFRNVLYIKNCSTAQKLLNLPDGIYAGLKQMADKFTSARCLAIMKLMSRLEGELRYTSQHRVLFEGAVVQACLSDGDVKTDELALRVAKLEKQLATLKRSDFNSPPAIMDARQVWVHVASHLSAEGYGLIAMTAQQCEMTMTDSEFCLCVPDGATYTILSDKLNRDALNRAFGMTKEAGGRKLVVKQQQHLGEDSTTPFLKDMFGELLEIK